MKLVVAKCWDPTPRNYVLPTPECRTEPVRPIDPSAWIAHTEAVRREEACTPTRAMMPAFGGSGSIGSSSLTNSTTGGGGSDGGLFADV